MTEAFVFLAFLVGIAVGVVLDDAWELVRPRKKEHDVVNAAPLTEDNANASQKAGFSTNTLGVLLIVCCLALAIAAGALLLTRASTEKYSRCTADWQQKFSTAYIARSDAASEVSKAVDDVMISVAALDSTDQKTVIEFRASLQRYLKIRSEQDKERTTNPLPPLPAILCGEGAP